MNTEVYQDLLSEALNMKTAGTETEQIRTYLSGTGADFDMIEKVMSELKRQTYLKRRKIGITIGITGSILLVTGFILTVIFYHSGISFRYVMYGTTSLGALLLVAGLIEIIG